VTEVTTPTLAEALHRRREAGEGLVAQAETVARACHAMAERFHAGGRLLCFGNGGAATDAAHVAVEFVHPVVVGKRALPALSLANDPATMSGVARVHGFDEVFAAQLRVLGAGSDIALGMSPDGECANVLRGLEEAHAAGMLTVALVGGDGGAVARSGACDHVVVVRSDDPRVVKEVHVTAYHVLWELVHVFFEQPGVLSPSVVR
jgi:D-sedoheptulose 7-phosphate isomerase